MEIFSKRLKESLKQQGISQKELAKKINMSPSVVNNYCSGKREPSLTVFVEICKALNEDVGFLLGLDKE